MILLTSYFCLQSHHRQTWRGDCLRHGHASRVSYFDIDLHSRSYRSYENNKGLIISETIQAVPITFAVKIVLTIGLYDHCQYDELEPSFKVTNVSQT